ncbi:MAG: hypothetical protein M1835_007585 [Candelina submexicana]|nr:MAG: hypothetical protein M1835_007585 [Candelina submexicana]
MSTTAVNTMPTTTATAGNLASDLKPPGSASANVKVGYTLHPKTVIYGHKLTDVLQPCCVCKDEKAARDECMLFSNSGDAQKECQETVEKYRTCMAGFGFKLP